ncbi:MAG: quaternary ammonium compound efflux SMR transporter SugE [Mesorhizobium sp.]|jgi:quaternary ammonium compound-resistance protein SugE|nr:quaternary ammonium compound efflux SMR transporter SugE [Mesorhizobium sp.]
MAWLYLGLAGLLEIVWASFLKQTEGFTRLTPSVITLVAMAGSFWLLALAMRSLPLGTAYAIWTGIGAVGAFVVGIVVMGEAATLGRIVSVALLITGMVGLKLSSGH